MLLTQESPPHNRQQRSLSLFGRAYHAIHWTPLTPLQCRLQYIGQQSTHTVVGVALDQVVEEMLVQERSQSLGNLKECMSCELKEAS